MLNKVKTGEKNSKKYMQIAKNLNRYRCEYFLKFFFTY